MKYYSLIFIFCFFWACSGRKHVVENSQQKASEKLVAANDIKVYDTLKIQENNSEEVSTKKITNKKKDSIYFIKITSHDKWNELLKKHVSESGNVDYKKFKTDRYKLSVYLKYLSENMPTDKWQKRHKLAYWINAYNAMTIDLILRHYPVKSIKDIKKPWEQRYWKLGDKWYNLNEIEHQILRKMDEPRIHFAIVCASVSCPKLLNKAYTSSNLEAQLTQATKDFLNDSNRNEISQNNIKLSKIFQWFAKDFKQNGTLIDFLNKYTEIKISDNAKSSFKDYNWDLNE